MKPFVSVIVPIFKVDGYLVRCLDSLCRQSLRNIEIILVDDGSPDRCGAICEEYAAKDTRIKVIHHKENRGLSEARNTGIKEAVADYLMFVDGDDWVHEDYCRLPYKCAIRYQADLVLFNYKSIDSPLSSWNKNEELPILKQSVEYSDGIASLKSSYKTKIESLALIYGQVGQTAWNKLYNKRIFENISYPKGYLFEDLGTTYKTIIKATSIYYLDEILYYYNRIRFDRISTCKTKKALQDRREMLMQQYCDVVNWWSSSGIKTNFFLNNIAMSYCIMSKRSISDKRYMFCENTLRTYKKIPKEFNFKKKVLFVLLKYCPNLFELVCLAGGKKVNLK